MCHRTPDERVVRGPPPAPAPLRPASADGAFLTLPERSPKVPLQDLQGTREGQRIGPEFNRLGNLEAGDAIPAPRLDLLLGGRGAELKVSIAQV